MHKNSTKTTESIVAVYAHFGERLLAAVINTLFLSSFFFLALSLAAQEKTLAQAVYILFSYLLIVCSPFVVFLFVFLTHTFGADPGKFVTGLRVVDKNGTFLSFWRALFRHAIGYTFSFIFFGLGYWSMLVDNKRQTWHDKATGSFVIRKHMLWPFGFFIAILLLAVNGYLFFEAVRYFSHGPLAKEFTVAIQKIQQEEQMKEEKSREKKVYTEYPMAEPL